MESLQKKDSELKSITVKLDSIMTQLEEARAENRQNAENVNTLTSLLNGMTAERDRLRLELEKKAGENAVNRKFRFAGHSQKGTSVKKQTGGRDDGRDDFDATADLLSNLAFNKYGQMTPLYREINRFRNENMLLSRQTLTNWLGKAAGMLEKLLPSLKAKALAPGSIVNVDETWNRLHLVCKSGKVYIWCLVNRLAKTVIFFYDEGSRGRSVLKDFIGDAELAALQSDGYNAYNYIDNQLVKIEHICCPRQ